MTENMGKGRKGRPDDDGEETPPAGEAVTQVLPKTKRPSLYKVLLLNDDYTPMDFVVQVLENIFGKKRNEAIEVMLQVHRRGVGLCGVYTFEVAETKVAQVVEVSRRNEHPLQCTIEKE